MQQHSFYIVEIIQNKKLLTNQEYTIGQNEAKIKELDVFIEDRTNTKKMLVEEISILNDNRVSLNSQIRVLTDSLDSINTEINGKRLENSNREDSLNQMEISLNKKNSELDLREGILSTNEKTIKDKHTRIKDFINEIN